MNDPIKYKRQFHKQNTCQKCNGISWGDRALNDYTKKCGRHNHQKSNETNNIPIIKPTNIFKVIMVEGVKKQEIN